MIAIQLLALPLATHCLVLLCLLSVGLYTGDVRAGQVRVAVATNFLAPMQQIKHRFQQQGEHSVALSAASTGKLFAQIQHGAPFDVFFAADLQSPLLLEQSGLAQPGSRYTYAVGELVLWSSEAQFIDPLGKVLEQGQFNHLALANPKLAPYGRAAQQVLAARQLWVPLQPKLVFGENIGQTLQFVATGNAQLGFVAKAQLIALERYHSGSRWDIPRSMYTPIAQAAVTLKKSPATQAFMAFVRGAEARAIIQHYGYSIP